jgi:hypothetical protein
VPHREREYAGATVEVALARLTRQPDVPSDLPDGWPGLLRAMTDREPARRPTPAEAARDLAAIASGGEATTVLAAAAPVDATTALPRTAVAPAPPVYRPAPEPVRRPAARAVPVAAPSSSNATPWILLLLAVIAALVVGFLLYEQTRTTGPGELPAIRQDLPVEIREPLEGLHDAVDAEVPE